jgi:hypothetical protein
MTQPLIQKIMKVVFLGKADAGDFFLVPKLRMNGATLSILSYAFMTSTKIISFASKLCVSFFPRYLYTYYDNKIRSPLTTKFFFG